MLYDIPGRTGTPIAAETLVRSPSTRRIVAVKDAKADFGAASWVMARTSLVFYSGDDMVNLPWLALGAAGFVSVVGHVVGRPAARDDRRLPRRARRRRAAASTANCCRSTPGCSGRRA